MNTFIAVPSQTAVSCGPTFAGFHTTATDLITHNKMFWLKTTTIGNTNDSEHKFDKKKSVKVVEK